jgi:hypothetical protein
MQGKYQTASHINNTYYWYDRNGVGYKVEPMKKGSESYYTGGFWHEYAAGGSSMSGVYDSNIVGQAPHRSRVGTGMKIFNKLWNNPALESYWIMTIVDEEATRAGCDKGSGFIEPRDACYEWDGNGTCSSLNQYNQDGRPRWFTY